MLLVIFIAGAILWNLPWSKYDNQLFVSAVEPGYLDFDNLPDTNFSCDGKVIGGYYADIETGCQMFHVCTIGQKSEITDIKFLCLNGTVFDQETRVCERLDEVDCSRSESFFDLNLELYGNNGGGYGIQPEDEGKEQEGHNCEDEYEDGDSSCKSKPEKTNATDHKDAEYADWEDSTTDSAPRISSTSSTTTPKPSITTSLRPTSTSPPKFHFHSDISIPSTTPDPGLQLLALHENFQHNLKQHDIQSKLRPINVPPKNTSIFNYPKKPSPFQTYQIPNNAPQAKPHPYFPLSPPSKLPNSLSNLSQNKNPLSTSLANSNRTPQPFPVTFKPEPPPGFYTEKQHSQKVANKATLPPLPSPPKHQNIEPPVLYAYKILSTDSGRPDRFGSTNVRYSLQSSPLTAPGKSFATAHPTFTIAQHRPYTFPSKPPHFLIAKEEFEDDADAEDVLLEKARQLQPKLDGYNMHSNFARAIVDRPKNASVPAVSVVLSTSSVSSSISSKPHSAISNTTSNAGALSGPKGAFVANQHNVDTVKSSIPSSALAMLKNSQPNITEINESLTEEQPYYDDANVEYDENSHEYKDILYPSDVQKIKQR